MSQVIECEGALSNLVLQAARAAIPAQPDRLLQLPDCGPQNQPLLLLLVGLIDATKVVAAAIADNAWDNCRPIDSDLAVELAANATAIANDLRNATACPDAAGWSMPSATGRELL